MPPGENIIELQRRIAVYEDSAAYKELFITFYNRLRVFAYTFTRSKESSEEIVSDVFVRIWQNRKGLQEIENLPVYLYICTKNTAINYLLRQQRRESISLDDLTVELSCTSVNPEQKLITAEMTRRIFEVIDSLPPRCKLIYKLIKEDGLKYKEIAQILNISVKTVDNQLAIALHRIGQAINVHMKSVLN